MAGPLDDFTRVDGLLQAALDRPRADRAAFLDRACVDADGTPDAALRARLGRLLAVAEDDAADPGRPAAEVAGALVVETDGAVDDWTGRAVGPWQLVGTLGRGGAGAVYLGERDLGGAAQRAAVKLLRADVAALGGPVAAARFRQERAVLAGLDHPHVARLLDGGEGPGGVPYLATEVVDGEPITVFADRRGLDLESRLRLFLQVCDAVAYAHGRLVVHRDLKPSNVLVTEGPGGEPRAMLLDFGIAKLLEADPDEALTRVGFSPMTPAYAAPEVVAEGAATVAADVYGLGVVLYELLAGRRPFADGLPPDPSSGRSAVPEELAALTAEPPRPSALVLLPGGAEGRPPARRLRGDLDVIAQKAVAREPSRRYASVAELAADVRRHLEGWPIAARPDALAYRAARFVRRHRAATAGAAFGVAALVVGLGAALVALAGERDARAEAERDAARAEAASGFLVELFEAADPVRSGGEAVSAREVLDRGRSRVEALSDQPSLQGQLLTTMGRTYRSAGDLAMADSLLQAGLARTAAALGPDDPATARARVALGASRLAHADYDGALALYTAARDALAGALGPDAPDVSDAEEGVASALVGLDRTDEAEARFARLVARHQRLGDDERRARALLGVGYARQAAGRNEAALGPLREAYDLRREISGPYHARTVAVAVTLAVALGELDRNEEAEPLFRAALEGDRRIYGPRHPYVADDLANLGALQYGLGRFAEAERTQREALSLRREILPEGHPDIADSEAMLEAARAAQ